MTARGGRGDGQVRVVCRVRPSAGGGCVADAVAVADRTVEVVSDDRGSVAAFSFDGVLGTKAPQVEVYSMVARDLVEGVVDGFDGAVLCYGQTGSGKTYTLEGSLDERSSESAGMLPRAAMQFFELAAPLHDVVVSMSFIEIYLERIQDLLNPKNTNLAIRELDERGPRVQNCTEATVASPKELIRYVKIGAAARSVASTRMNDRSSRSHAICSITMSHYDADSCSRVTGTLHLVDLAGSERQTQSRAEGRRLDEAKMINRSLSTLADVITALTSGDRATPLCHVPYRNSKLTHILREALGGSARAVLLVNVSPAMADRRETLSSLRFGCRAKFVSNHPVANVVLQPPAQFEPEEAVPSPDPLPKHEQLAEEVQRLRELLNAEGVPLKPARNDFGDLRLHELGCLSVGSSLSSASTRTASTASLETPSSGSDLQSPSSPGLQGEQERLVESVLKSFGAVVDAQRFSDQYALLRQKVAERNAVTYLDVDAETSMSGAPPGGGPRRGWHAAVLWDFSARPPRLRAQLLDPVADAGSGLGPGNDAVPPKVVLDFSFEEFIKMCPPVP